MSSFSEYQLLRLQEQIKDEICSASKAATTPASLAKDVAPRIMDLVLRSSVVRPTIRRWYLASCAEQEQHEN